MNFKQESSWAKNIYENKNEEMVSILCITYNQETYIEDAINSFLMQITDFKYEIIIHDDASTDRTAKIIKAYEQQYPDVIRTICQTENQYSKKIPIIEKYMLPVSKGKYIALCEGDDYWTDPCKLQKQVNAMEDHYECDICAHATSMVNAETKKKTGMIMPSKEDRIFSIEEVIKGDGGFVATNSLMFRKTVFNKIPEFRDAYRIDYSMQIMGAIRGGMLYLHDSMSSYRVAAKASWYLRMNENPKKYIEHYQNMISMLKKLDAETKGEYKIIIDNRVRYQEIQILKIQNKYRKILERRYRDIFRELSGSERIKTYIKAIFPWLVELNEWRKCYARRK